MKILLTVAASFEDLELRYGHVTKTYSYLYQGLRGLGYDVYFYIHESAKHRRLKGLTYTTHKDIAFPDFVEKIRPDVAFIWGGRRQEDQLTKKVLRDCNPSVRLIFSELGWFPQRDNVYFDDLGTNAEARISRWSDSKLENSQRAAFLKLRKKILRTDLSLPFYKRVPDFYIEPPDQNKYVFVPLQDESDTNITESSPFAKMEEFVRWLSSSYPEAKFLVRPHPRAPVEGLPDLSNVTYQPANETLFSRFDEIGLVLGINSTVLLQSAMHNKSVIAVGDGIASFGGCVEKIDVNQPPASLWDFTLERGAALDRLAFLLIGRQIHEKKLKSSSFLKRSYLISMIEGG